MQTQDVKRRLLQKANELPLAPGVYLMKNREGRVIYVGKSRKLKNRVSQYFQNSQKGFKTERMVASVADFEYFVCDTEIEALTLENTLIKQYTPKYNIRLKDAKSYPYIKVTAGSYPRLQFTRTRQSDKGKYFGPYSGASVAGSVLRTLQQVLRLPTCNRQFPRDIGKQRPCLYHQLGQCCAPCTGKVSEEEYAELIHQATEILRGNSHIVETDIREKMEKAAEAEQFERAAAYRDRLFALQKLSQRQKVVADPETTQDVFGFYQDDYGAAMVVFYVRGGALTDRCETVFGNDEILDSEALISFVFEHYRTRDDIPPRILLSFEAKEDAEPLAQLLSDEVGHKVQVYTPQRGDRKQLCDLAVQNAAEKLAAARRENEKNDETMVRLAALLALEVVPARIESYDISNFGNECKTCGMIVWESGRFLRADYRTFRIRGVEGTDDYASMAEAIRRRFAHLSDREGSFSRMPDLLLLDGGAAHVGVVKRTLAEMGIEVPVFGMVKDQYHKTRALCTEEEEISIAQDRAVFTAIYRIQDEVHRFSVKQMSDSKRSTLKTSTLEKIPGVGRTKAKCLLSHFGGLADLRRATREQIAAAPGIGPVLADAVYQHFHKEKTQK